MGLDWDFGLRLVNLSIWHLGVSRAEGPARKEQRSGQGYDVINSKYQDILISYVYARRGQGHWHVKIFTSHQIDGEREVRWHMVMETAAIKDCDAQELTFLTHFPSSYGQRRYVDRGYWMGNYNRCECLVMNMILTATPWCTLAWFCLHNGAWSHDS